MKKVFATLVFAALAATAWCQTVYTPAEVDKKPVCETTRSLNAYVLREMKIPKNAAGEPVYGNVSLAYTVCTSGMVKDVTIVSATDPALAAEVVRVLETTAWISGQKEGTDVDVRQTFKISVTEEALEHIALPEKMPVFGRKGNLGDFRSWVASRLKYPKEAAMAGVQGRVTVIFVIEKDGTVGHIAVLESPDKDLAAEAVRVIGSSPKWQPGIKGGKKIRVKYTVSVDFRIPPSFGTTFGPKHTRNL